MSCVLDFLLAGAVHSHQVQNCSGIFPAVQRVSDLQRTSIGDISEYTGPIFVTAQPHPPTTYISSQPRAMKFIFSYEL